MAPETADLSVRFSDKQKNNILVITKNKFLSSDKYSIALLKILSGSSNDFFYAWRV